MKWEVHRPHHHQWGEPDADTTATINHNEPHGDANARKIKTIGNALGRIGAPAPDRANPSAGTTMHRAHLKHIQSNHRDGRAIATRN